MEELKDQLERFIPHLVVCSESNTADPGGMAAWIELSPEPAESSKYCLEGQNSEVTNPNLAELLRLVDEAEELVQTGTDLKGC